MDLTKMSKQAIKILKAKWETHYQLSLKNNDEKKFKEAEKILEAINNFFKNN